MTFDWDLWPHYIARAALSGPSVDVGGLVDSIDLTMATLGEAILPVVQRVARALALELAA